MSISGIIVDLDGVLIDNEIYGKQAWYQAAEEMGFEFQEKNYAKLIGRSMRNCHKFVKSLLPEEIDVYEYIIRWHIIYEHELEKNGLALMHGVSELLQLAKYANLDIGVATTSDREIAERNIQISGLCGDIGTLVTTDDVENGKPAPDIYLLTAKMMKLPIEKCVVIEDSEAGVAGAHEAGAIPILVPSTVPPTETARAVSYSVEDTLLDVLSTIEFLYFNRRAH